MPPSEDFDRETLPCPRCDYSEDYDPDSNTSTIATKVDLGIHWKSEHGGTIPDEADFGDQQCPQCHDLLGFNGTTSCSECGFIQRCRA